MNVTRQPSIVVGIELDETGDIALRRAAVLSAATGARIHLCLTGGGNTAKQAENEQRLFRAASQLIDWARPRLGKDEPLGKRTELHVTLGDPAQELSQLAVDVHADMIVVGSHQRSGLDRLAHGSVVRDLIQCAPCAVMVALVDERAQRPKSSVVSSGGPFSYRRPVYLGGPQSQTAAAHA